MAFIDRESNKSLRIPEIMEMIRPFSEVGRRLKSSVKNYAPGKEDELRAEYQKIRSLMHIIKTNKEFTLTVSSSLSKIENIKQTFVRATTTQTLELTEIYEIKNFLYYYEKIRMLMEKNRLTNIVRLLPFNDLYLYLDPEEQKIPTFHISSRYSDLLASLRVKHFEINNKINYLDKKGLEQAKQELELHSVEKQIVVSRQNKKLLNKLENTQWFTVSEENFANITYVYRQSEEVMKLERELNSLRHKIEEEELKIRTTITAQIAEKSNELISTLNEIAKLDYLIARSIFGCEIDGTIPSINRIREVSDRSHRPTKSSQVVITFSRVCNLYIKKQLDLHNMEYQPLDINFSERINIITGANMAGKSTVLQTIGQLFCMTAYAIPLPCQKAHLPLVDFVFFSSDTESSFRTDLSSFASELIAINNAVKQPGVGLFLIDEFARGTNPQEGESFARAILEVFVDKKAVVVSATHFSTPSHIRQAAHFRIIGLTKNDYEKLKKTLSPYDPGKKDDLKSRIQELHKYMNYQLESVETSNIPPRAALIIAEILGIDEEIIERAKGFMKGKHH